MGGRVNSGAPISRVFEYDPVTKKITHKPPMITARAGEFDATVVDGKVYVSGGQSFSFTPETNGYLDDFEVYDPALDIFDYKEKIFVSVREIGTNNYHIWSVNSKGENLKQLTFGEVVDLAPSLSPNGRILAFNRAPLSRPDDHSILTLDLITGEETKLTTINDAANSLRSKVPSWTPDGKKIVFFRDTSGPGSARIWTIDYPSKNNLEQLSQNGLSRASPSVSPYGGRDAVYVHEIGSGSFGIYKLDLTTQVETPFIPHVSNEYSPQYSPNGRYIAWMDFRHSGSGDVFIAETSDPSNTVCRVTPQTGFQVPNWSPYADKLIFPRTNSTKIYTSASACNSSPELLVDFNSVSDFVHNLSSGIAASLKSPESDKQEKIVFAGDKTGNGNWDIYMINPDGSDIEQITTDPAIDVNPVLSPDGTKLAFLSERNNTRTIFVKDLSTGLLDPIYDDPRINNGPSWDNNSQKLIFSMGSAVGVNIGVWEIALPTPDDLQPQPRRITPPLTQNPQWHHLNSENCGWDNVIFQSNENLTNSWSIWKADKASGQTQEIVERFSSTAEYEPTCNREGDWIAWEHFNNSNDSDLWIADFNGQNRQIVPGLSNIELTHRPSFSPSSSSLVFDGQNRSNSTRAIWRVDLNGNNLEQLTSYADFVEVSYPNWGVIAINTDDQPGSLKVTPEDELHVEGEQGGPFDPTSIDYTLTNTGDELLNYEFNFVGNAHDSIIGVTSLSNWVTLTDSGSGALEAGETTSLKVAFNEPESLIAAFYSGVLTITNTTNGNGDTTRDVSLRVLKPGNLSISPSSGFNPEGFEGGPFSPNSKTYTATNSGETDLNFTVTKTQSWLDVSSTGGTLSGSQSEPVTLSINALANNLTPGIYNDSITYTYTTTSGKFSGTFTQPVTLTVKKLGELSLTSSGNLDSIGEEGGPFSPDSVSYVLTNIGESSVGFALANNQEWTTVTPNSGTLNPGASIPFTVSINTNANSLFAGSYTDTVKITNTTNGRGNRSEPVNLTILTPGTLEVIGNDLISEGEFEGPFDPPTEIYTLTNTGQTSLTYSASSVLTWLDISPPSGSLEAGSSIEVTVNINSEADILTPGTYSGGIDFTNTKNNRGNKSFSAQLTVVDTTEPTVVAPENITKEATGPLTQVELGEATATDIVDGELIPINDAPADGFPVKTTTVIWSATDLSGNTGQDFQEVTIVDTTAPVFGNLPTITVEQAAIGDTDVNLETPTATDLVGVVSVTNNAPENYEVGERIVTWTALDEAGNAGTAPQTVKVTPLSKQTAKEVLKELKRQRKELEKQFKEDKKALERSKKEAEKEFRQREKEIRKIKDKAERRRLLAELRVERRAFREQFRENLRALRSEFKANLATIKAQEREVKQKLKANKRKRN